MLNALRTMDEVDRRRIRHALLWLVAAVVLTLGSEFSHWWRHRAAAAPAATSTVAAAGANAQAH